MEKNNTQQPIINRQKFNLVAEADPSWEDYGWTREFLEEMLYVEAYEPDHEWMKDHEILNNLGIIFSEAIGVRQDMEKAIKYYTRAIALDDDLARSNLADIYRKGTGGIEKDHALAFELYRACHLPYAYYRVGEAYELGRGVAKDLEAAKENYRIAYREGHPLARKKLQEFNFLR